MRKNWIHVVFSKITKEEWKEFKAICNARGQTITWVLQEAIKNYVKGGNK